MLQAAVKTQPPLFLTSAISVFKTPVCPEKNILQYTCNIKQLDYINYKGPYKNTSQLVFGSDSILSVEFYLSPRLVDL